MGDNDAKNKRPEAGLGRRRQSRRAEAASPPAGLAGHRHQAGWLIATPPLAAYDHGMGENDTKNSTPKPAPPPPPPPGSPIKIQKRGG